MPDSERPGFSTLSGGRFGSEDQDTMALLSECFGQVKGVAAYAVELRRKSSSGEGDVQAGAEARKWVPIRRPSRMESAIP